LDGRTKKKYRISLRRNILGAGCCGCMRTRSEVTTLEVKRLDALSTFPRGWWKHSSYANAIGQHWRGIAREGIVILRQARNFNDQCSTCLKIVLDWKDLRFAFWISTSQMKSKLELLENSIVGGRRVDPGYTRTANWSPRESSLSR
jgi:hypothetical protein